MPCSFIEPILNFLAEPPKRDERAVGAQKTAVFRSFSDQDRICDFIEDIDQ